MNRFDKVMLPVLALMFSFTGVVSLVTGNFETRGNGGPPLTGNAATIAGLMMMAFGVYMFYIFFSEKK